MRLPVPVLTILLCGAPLAPALAQTPEAGQTRSPDQLLKFADQRAANFKDAYFHFKMRIKEPSGQIREVEFETWQKGNQRRLVKFLNPGDIKGMGFLSESADVMYALLPAFGNRVRRLGTHQRNQSFMGSDLSYEDMSAIELSSMYDAKDGGTDGALKVLELSVKSGKQAEFPRMKISVDPSDGTIPRLEYQDAAGKKLRTQVRAEFKEEPALSARYPHKLIFTDHRRNNHETELVLVDSKFNTGVPDDKFTQRSLSRD